MSTVAHHGPRIGGGKSPESGDRGHRNHRGLFTVLGVGGVAGALALGFVLGGNARTAAETPATTVGQGQDPDNRGVDTGAVNPTPDTTPSGDPTSIDIGEQLGEGIVMLSPEMSEQELVTATLANQQWLVRQPGAITREGLITLASGFIDLSNPDLAKLLQAEAINFSELYAPTAAGPEVGEGYAIAGSFTGNVTENPDGTVTYEVAAEWTIPLQPAADGKAPVYPGTVYLTYRVDPVSGNLLLVGEEQEQQD